MDIKHPELLVLIFVFVGFFIFLLRSSKKQEQILRVFCDPSKLLNIFPNASPFKNSLRLILLITALLMFVVSLISPRWGYDWQQVETRGVNIMIAVDLSKSMLAEDISPNRLTRAKLELIKLLDKLNGDRAGLIIFAGEGFLQSPLTHDYLMLKDWIMQISTDSIAVEGTSIKSAIELARKAFKHLAPEDPKALIIISDGEEQDKATIDEASRAKAEHIKIYSIGIGTNEGSPIPTDSGFMKDESGNLVITKLDDSLLKKIAEQTDGYYVRSSTGDFHIDTLYYDHIKGELKGKLLKSGKTKVWQETYQIFMLIAFLALLLELFMSFNLISTAFFQKIFAKKTRNIFGLSKKIILIFIVLRATIVQANVFDASLWSADHKLKTQQYSIAKEEYLKLQVKEPHNPRLNYNLGVSLYRTDSYKEAIGSFARGSAEANHPTLQEAAFYNLGNAYFKTKKYKEAITAYEKALKINPKDEDAKFNLELAKKLLEDGDGQDDQNNGQGKQGQDKQNQQDKKDNKDKDKKQDKQDKKGDGQGKNNSQDKQNQPKNQPQNQPRLNQDDVNNILRNVNEAAPPRNRSNGGSPRSNLKPW